MIWVIIFRNYSQSNESNTTSCTRNPLVIFLSRCILQSDHLAEPLPGFTARISSINKDLNWLPKHCGFRDSLSSERSLCLIEAKQCNYLNVRHLKEEESTALLGFVSKTTQHHSNGMMLCGTKVYIWQLCLHWQCVPQYVGVNKGGWCHFACVLFSGQFL